MEFAKVSTQYVCGIDLHSTKMYICVMDKEGNIQLHRNMPNDFKLFNNLIDKYKNSLSVGVESMHSYYWLADACKENKIPFYLGHAYYMKAIHGGKKKNSLSRYKREQNRFKKNSRFDAKQSSARWVCLSQGNEINQRLASQENKIYENTCRSIRPYSNDISSALYEHKSKRR